MMDIDFFKKINDTWGHLCGDEVLKKITSLIDGRTRTHDIFARYGGEEFVVILPETELEDGIKLAESLRLMVESEVINNNGKTFSVTMSLGVAALRDSVNDASGLLDLADSALYEAKRSGRNKVVSMN
jgi:diguanylate cyclase (GGDEF)-like protein